MATIRNGNAQLMKSVHGATRDIRMQHRSSERNPGTFCIERGYELLRCDASFEPMAKVACGLLLKS
jgi:hypothetical protein